MSVKDRDWMRDGEPPPEVPSLSMKEMAVSIHELFTSYVDAGFTEEQALQLVMASLQKP